MVDELIAQAGETQRLRINYNIHESLSDPVQRLFIAAGLSSYFRPHRHLGTSEFAIVIRGLFDVIVFDDEGVVTERISAGPGTDAIRSGNPGRPLPHLDSHGGTIRIFRSQAGALRSRDLACICSLVTRGRHSGGQRIPGKASCLARRRSGYVNIAKRSGQPATTRAVPPSSVVTSHHP